MPEQCSPYSGNVLVKFNGLLYIGIQSGCKKVSAKLSLLALPQSTIRGFTLLALSMGSQLMEPPSLSLTAGPMTYPPPPHLVPTLQQSAAEIYHELANAK